MEIVKWYWFSFASERGFLGATAADGTSFKDAHERLSSLGLNPGGEVKAMELPGCYSASQLAPYEPYRLYTKAEMEAIDGVERF